MYLQDKTKFNDPEKWLNAYYKESPAFISFNDIWTQVRTSYETDLRLLVYGEFPSEQQVADKFSELINILMK